MTSVLILLGGFDPGTYYIEDDGDPDNGVAQLRSPDGSVILFNIPTEFLTVTASAGRSVVFNLTESFGAADINVGSLTDPAQNPDSITIQTIRTGGDVTLASNGFIREVGNDAAADVIAGSVIFSANTGVGSGTNAIETQVATLEAETNTGGINLANIGALTIGGLTDDVVGLDVETAGNLRIVNFGTITIAEQSPGGFESIHGGSTSGNIEIIAEGATSDIVVTVDRDTIAAPGGSIVLTAGRDVSLGTQGLNFDNDVRARGNLTINTGRDLNVDGFSDLASDGFGAATGGDVIVNAGRDINVLNSTGTDGSIGAEGSGGGNVVFNTGAGGFVRLLATSASTLFSSSGNVTVNADRMVISASSGITASNGTVTLRPITEGWAIDLGSATDGAFALELSDAEADRIFTSMLTIGSTTGGLINASGAFGPGSVPTLRLLSGIDILLRSALTVSGELILRAGDNVHFLSGSATTTDSLTIFVDEAQDDGGEGGAVTFGGAITPGPVTIDGNINRDILFGIDGVNQTVHGHEGSDIIHSSGEGSYFGDGDNDTIFAGESNALIDEILDGGSGTDTLDITSVDSTYEINLATGVTNFSYERFVNFENLRTGDGNDSIIGTRRANLVETGLGNDTINSRQGNDIVNSGGGTDTLRGKEGSDTLNGGSEADILDGGLARDFLTGGSGNDTFEFRNGDTGSTNGTADVVEDFVQGQDLINLLIDADTGTVGNQNFTFIGTSVFSGTAGEVRYVQQGGRTFVQGDVNGDSVVDFVIDLAGTINLTGADFVL